MRTVRDLSAVVAASITLFLPSLAQAQAQAGGQSTLIDPSVRSAGMGRTGVAVFWGGDPNVWNNPSLLGYYQGIRYEGGKTQLVPDLADDVTFTSNQITLGGYGVGISMEGDPFDDFGGLKLDYGTSVATDVDGNPIATFSSYETIESFALGVSVAQLAESVARAFGGNLPAITRYGDVSLGHTWKTVKVDLAPASVTLDGKAGYGEANQGDRGIFGRVTPYNAIQYPGTWPGLERHLRARLDLSYGFAAINYDENETISYIDVDQADPFAEDFRRGWAVHADFTLPESAEQSLGAEGLGWIYDIIAPLISFGSTWEKSQYSVQGVNVGQEIDLSGWELTFANIFTLRQGHIDDPTGTIIGDTKGWSVGLSFDGVGGARYDHATVPQSIYLTAEQTRKGFTVWLDPIALSQRLH
jgi:hypothetical protein